LTRKITEQLKRLRPGFVIGEDGRILEWDREYKEVEPGHRHMSHLYGFHPGNQITIDQNPELFKAVKKTVDYRLNNGGAHTGWSRAWLINISARLLDGEMAFENIQMLFKNSLYTNLFDAHPPFQIDGNFGYTAGVTEMLLQSHEKKGIRLLPALPGSWSSGSVIGLIARNNIIINMKWDNNEIKQVSLKTNSDKSVPIIYKNKIFNFNLKKNEIFIHKF
jgi:alpha-L-fucosidase 2